MKDQAQRAHRILAWLFFLAGIPTINYQIIWQRALYSLFGVNIEAITCVTASFMLGLGLGALAACQTSRFTQRQLLLCYALLELLIAIFGFFSLRGIAQFSTWSIHWPLWASGSCLFVILLIPIAAMGAGLPILVEYFSRQVDNLGKNTALIYAANIYGAAFACFLLAWGLMRLWGLQNTATFSAIVNGGIAITATYYALRAPSNPLPIKPIGNNKIPSAWLMLSCLCGFVSLSYEIIWLHVISFFSASRATALTAALGYFLLGLAVGSTYCYYLFKQHKSLAKDKLLSLLTITLLFASMVVPFMAALSQWQHPKIVFSLLSFGSAGFGMLLPIICAFAANHRHPGETLGLVYFTNIIGATIGCIITGFYVTNYLSIQYQFISLLILSWAIILWVILSFDLNNRKKRILKASAITVIIALIGWFNMTDVFSKLFYKAAYTPAITLKRLYENNVGVVAITQDKKIIGNGAYDGSLSVTMGPKDIIRPYLISLFIPLHSRILVIGLSAGPWVQILANNPRIDQLDVVEINPAYLTLIQHEAIVRSLLSNPKVHIHISDGRRWLIQHPQQYDLIISNTTYSWRYYASLLLSSEFYQLLKQHLTPRGFIFINTTSSKMAIATILKAFPYTTSILSCIVASTHPLKTYPKAFKRLIEHYQIDNKSTYHAKSPDQNAWLNKTIDQLLHANQHPEATAHSPSIIYGRKSLIQISQGADIITDNNMGDEWDLTK